MGDLQYRKRKQPTEIGSGWNSWKFRAVFQKPAACNPALCGHNQVAGKGPFKVILAKGIFQGLKPG
jgi:hypothetical protein